MIFILIFMLFYFILIFRVTFFIKKKSFCFKFQKKLFFSFLSQTRKNQIFLSLQEISLKILFLIWSNSQANTKDSSLIFFTFQKQFTVNYSLSYFSSCFFSFYLFIFFIKIMVLLGLVGQATLYTPFVSYFVFLCSFFYFYFYFSFVIIFLILF